VLIHFGLHCSCSCNRDNRQGDQFFGSAGIGAFTTLLCYAKIAPAALHRGEFAIRRRERSEAVGRKLKFGLRGFSPRTRRAAAPAVDAAGMAPG
jgi:hypothetical protein